MTQARLQRLSFEEYLNYNDGTDNRYELVDGLYEETVFTENQAIVSGMIPGLSLTPAQIFGVWEGWSYDYYPSKMDVTGLPPDDCGGYSRRSLCGVIEWGDC